MAAKDYKKNNNFDLYNVVWNSKPNLNKLNFLT